MRRCKIDDSGGMPGIGVGEAVIDVRTLAAAAMWEVKR